PVSSLFPYTTLFRSLERVGVEACRAAQLLDREVDLIRDQKIEAENVMRRLAGAAAIEPFAVAKLVAFPRLADRQAGKQRNQAGRSEEHTSELQSPDQ